MWKRQIMLLGFARMRCSPNEIDWEIIRKAGERGSRGPDTREDAGLRVFSSFMIPESSTSPRS